uniref:FERM domain-containing protein n=1 Tax=Oncorhynchus tshawytscha TaxID=74940 RepID=A0A8C8HY61_ONCTS
MSCFCTAQEEFYCEVLLLDETKLTLTTQQQGIKKSTKGSVVLDFVLDHVKLAETDFFGLRYCDRSHQTYKTCTVFHVLYGCVSVCVSGYCRYQFFLQVKQDVLQGRIPCPLDISAQLAALAIQSELGDYDPYKHVSGYVSEYRFVPDQKEELEHAIEMIHKTVMGQIPSKAEHNYLGIAKTLDMYGVDLHPVFGENQSEYFLGLTPIGVVVYKNKTQVGKYFWPRITKVHFKETQFELQVVGKDCTETSFFFKAPNKTACKHLWKCCIEHHTFFRMPENDGNTLTRKLSKFGSLGSKHRYSGKTAMQMGRDLSVGLPRPDLSYTNNIPSHLFDPGQLLTLLYSPLPTRRSRSRGNTSSGSESETSTREHRKKRNRSRQENEMVDSGPQWEAVLCRQKERSQNDPNHRRSRHRSRSRSPDVQAKEQLWKHIQKELVDPAPDLTEDQLKEIPYKKVETQGDPIKIRHSHSPRSFHQYRRSQCSEGERSVPDLMVFHSSRVSPEKSHLNGTQSEKQGSKDTLLSEIIEHDVRSNAKVVKTVHTPRTKVET